MKPSNKPIPKTLDGALPHFTISFLPYDPVKLVGTILHRGPNVRSVPNCHSIPSGLLEHGEPFNDAIIREMREEIAVDYARGVDGAIRFHTLYRNIPDDGFDWVIGIWSVPIQDLVTRSKNMEPHKHDAMQHLDLRIIRRMCEGERLNGDLIAPALGFPLLSTIDQILDRS